MDGVCERTEGAGPGVCERGGVVRAAAAADAEDMPGPGVCDRGAGVCDRGGAGVCERVGESGVAGVVGREDMDAERACMALNRERGEAAEDALALAVETDVLELEEGYVDWEELYGVGEGVGDVGTDGGISGTDTPRVVASVRSWETSCRSCWHSDNFWFSWDRCNETKKK